MNKKNVYFFQPTFMNTNSIHFPYASGAIVSYAWSFEDISQNYKFKKCFFLRHDPEKVAYKLEEPYIAAFSCYMWNFEYNKTLASIIKKCFPECRIIFGGPQIAPGHDLLLKYDFLDVLIHGEGEVVFRDYLRTLAKNSNLEEVSNISFRSDNNIIDTACTVSKDFNFPSPYQTGFFDKIIDEYPEIDFIPLIETNRGCPNGCTYCSWGMQKTKIRLFPMERVLFDIEWVCKHKMEFLGFADANFGILSRDEEITDKIISMNKTYGYPKKFQVSFSKNSEERVFRITKKLNEKHMDKGVTLSFQSMSDEVQKNIGRSNMYIDHFKYLLKKYNNAGIPTYTDLILGLPGETVDSFKKGIEILLELGQHMALFVHLCEWLPCSEMGKKEYMDRFGIRYKEVPINQPHASRSDDKIQELSRIITSTNSMNEEDWKKMVMISTVVLCFHHLGLLRLVALYLYHEKSVKYMDFYSGLLDYIMNVDSCPAHNSFSKIQSVLDDVINNSGAVVIYDDRFGNIAWPLEEFAFLDIVFCKEDFFKNIREYIYKFIPKDDADELVDYQSFAIKTAKFEKIDFYAKHDWKTYFDNILKNEDADLSDENVHYIIDIKKFDYTWEEYAKKVIWFGRRGGKNLYDDEIKKK